MATLVLGGCADALAADTDADALALQPETEQEVAPAATKLFVEGLVGWADQRYDPDSRTIGRASIDLRHASRLGASTQAVVSARVDATDPSDPRISGAVLSLREAHLGWQNETADQVLGVGRISLREGPGYGYNPTDFFRDNTLRTFTTADPMVRRELRLGTVMLRGQHLWPGGSVAVDLSPKLATSPSDEGMSADLGATNNRNRGVLSVSYRISEKLNTQLLLYKEDDASARVGANMSALVSDAAVVHAEWSYGREPDLLSRALSAPAAESARSRVVAGLTYTTATKLSITAEYQYNGFALDKAAWQALSTQAPAAAGAYFLQAQVLQDNAARDAVLLYAVQRDLFVKNLELTAMLQLNRTDLSSLTWAELRYRFDKAELALQFQHTRGVAGSEFGMAPIKDGLALVGVAYF